MLTARSLELYDKPGAGAAAREISKAVTLAKKAMVKALKGVRGSPFDGRREVRREVVDAYMTAWKAVYEVLKAHSKMGACDTEPVCHVSYALSDALAKHYKLDEWDARKLRIRLY